MNSADARRVLSVSPLDGYMTADGQSGTARRWGSFRVVEEPSLLAMIRQCKPD
jgi:hypothetical protein